MLSSVCLGVKAPPDDERRAERHPQRHVRDPERVEHRHAQLGRLARAERHLAEQAADRRDSERGSERGAPFGVPVVPLVRITILGPVEGFGGELVEPRAIRLSIVSSASDASPSVHARQRPCGGSIPSSIWPYSSS